MSKIKIRNWIGQSYQSQNPQFDCSRTINMRLSVDENQTGTNQQLFQLLSTPGLTSAVIQPGPVTTNVIINSTLTAVVGADGTHTNGYSNLLSSTANGSWIDNLTRKTVTMNGAGAIDYVYFSLTPEWIMAVQGIQPMNLFSSLSLTAPNGNTTIKQVGTSNTNPNAIYQQISGNSYWTWTVTANANAQFAAPGTYAVAIDTGQQITTAGSLGGSVRGGYTTSQGSSYCVIGSTLYYLSGPQAPYTPVAIGTLNSSSGRVRFADNGNECVLVDGNWGYYFYIAGGQTAAGAGFTQINDPAWLGATFVEYYDGYFLFNQPGTGLFYWSNANSIQFNALNFATKSGNPDPISGLVVIQRQLWLIGTLTTEVWYDVGGTVTFQRLSGPYNEWGCIAPNSIAKSEYGIFWIAQNSRGGSQAFMTNGNSMVPIGSFAIQPLLQEFGQNLSQATGLCYQHDGCLFYQINPPAGSSTSSSFVYDYNTSQFVEEATWHERSYTVQPYESTLTVPNGTQQRHLGDVAWMYNGQVLVGSYRDSNVYFFDEDNATDNGAYRTQTRVGPHIMSNGERMFFDQFRLICQTGQQGSNVTVTTSNTSNQSVNLSFTANVQLGACTYCGYAANDGNLGAYGAPFGSLNGNVVNGGQITGFFLSTTNQGANAQNFFLFMNGTPAQNIFNSVTFKDVKGNTITLLSNTATYQTNYPGVGETNWLWNADPGPPDYNWFSNTGLAPFLATENVTFAYTQTIVTSVVNQIAAQVQLSWSDDGGYTWSNPIPMPLGAQGQYSPIVEWWQLGSSDEGRNRVFRVICTDPVQLNMIDAVIHAYSTDT